MLYLLLIAVALAGWLFLARANELCVIRVSAGGASLVRGRAPARFLSDVRDIARRAAVEDATIRVVVQGGAPRVVASGVSETVLQQLRNAAGQHQVLHFRAGRRP